MRKRAGAQMQTVYVAVVSLSAFSVLMMYLLVSPPTAFQNTTEVEQELLKTKFEQLSVAGTNFCAGPDILDSVDSDSLQGSCCGPMDFHRYSEQVDGLKKYSGIDVIPSDPYNISRELADRLLAYQETIELTEEEQVVYDEATGMSMEGGPCCCKCWRWYAFEGQAKYLIKYNGFNAHQIAEVWDLEDGCGGEGHGTDHVGGMQ